MDDAEVHRLAELHWGRWQDGIRRNDPLAVDALMRLLSDMPRIELRGPTKKQIETLQLIANGHTTPSAARARGVSYETIKTDLKRVREKLNARNTTHAVALAWRKGLIR